MKIGLAQINSRVGDFPYNAKRILQAYRACLDEGADLVVTPAYALCGYPLHQLASQEKFVSKCLQALDYLSDEVKSVPLLVGHTSPLSQGSCAAATLLAKGCTPITYYNSGYGSDEVLQIDLEGGVGDLFLGEEASDVSAADFVVQMAVDPYDYQEKSEPTVATKRPTLICNATGVNDGYVFGGRSRVLAKNGCIGQLPSFSEGHLVVDLDSVDANERVMSEGDGLNGVYEALVLGVREFVSKAGYNGTCMFYDGSLESQVLVRIAADAGYPLLVLHEDGYAPVGLDFTNVTFEKVELGRLRDLVLQDFGESRSGEGLLKLMAITHICERDGYLHLSSGSKTSCLLGESDCMSFDYGGLAVLADVTATLLVKLAQWISANKYPIPESLLVPVERLGQMDLVLEYVSAGEQAEATIEKTGLAEHLVRGVFRRFNLSHLKRRHIPVKIGITSTSRESSESLPIIQTFVD